jgi:hypothetical protein
MPVEGSLEAGDDDRLGVEAPGGDDGGYGLAADSRDIDGPDEHGCVLGQGASSFANGGAHTSIWVLVDDHMVDE